MNEDKRAELLMDHYKDTFEHVLYHWKVRNRLFICILALLAVMALDMAQPGSLGRLANRYLDATFPAQPQAGERDEKASSGGSGSQTAPNATLDFSAAGSLAWFLLLCLVVHYYQRSIHVDRQYNYLGGLEDQLCSLMGGDPITREGKAYLTRRGVCVPGESQPGDQRPLYLRAVGPLYVYVFPGLLSLFVIAKLWRDWSPPHATFWLNLVVGLVILGYNGLYLTWVQWRR